MIETITSFGAEEAAVLAVAVVSGILLVGAVVLALAFAWRATLAIFSDRSGL
jgi:hypothetical protein